RGGRAVPLPPSRKTRALLAYLAIVGRPQNREHLCEMFWDVPDDPRGSLRWSLSKLRKIVNSEGHEPLTADRNFIELRIGQDVTVDWHELKTLSSAGLDVLALDEIERWAGQLDGFLDDLSLPRCPVFEAWRIALANEFDVLRCRFLRAAIDNLRQDPARALPFARALCTLNPDDGALGRELAALSQAARGQAVQPGAPPVRQASVEADDRAAPARQEIRFCTTADNVRIAYALTGKGYPIVKAANWMSHLHYDRESPVWRHWVEGLSQHNRLIRYDERGNGLSDWTVDDLSAEAMLADLEAIVAASGVDRFALLGISQGCAISVMYAVRHPERVSHLVLYGGYVRGWRARGDPAEIARRSAMGVLIRRGWGQNNPAFRQMFTSLFIPGATQEHMSWFNELQLKSVSAENAARLHNAFGKIDVTRLLPQVSTPTLVLHARDDAVIPFEQGWEFAGGIPNARFVTLDSGNHILLDNEPAFFRFLSEVHQFLGSQP
ncbi:MAG TPA: alpha/beta fold hydrolase, partial [Woeseiaceae bacterium]|nr:alpha/beta fold hydrolase [Woeseiaceae bacterium]